MRWPHGARGWCRRGIYTDVSGPVLATGNTAGTKTAQDLPFNELGHVEELSGDQCDFNERDKEAEVQSVWARCKISALAPGFVECAKCTVQPLLFMQFARFLGSSPAC